MNAPRRHRAASEGTPRPHMFTRSAPSVKRAGATIARFLDGLHDHRPQLSRAGSRARRVVPRAPYGLTVLDADHRRSWTVETGAVRVGWANGDRPRPRRVRAHGRRV